LIDRYEALNRAMRSLKGIDKAYILLKTYRDKNVEFSIIINDIYDVKLEHTKDYSIELWNIC